MDRFFNCDAVPLNNGSGCHSQHLGGRGLMATGHPVSGAIQGGTALVGAGLEGRTPASVQRQP